MDKIEKVNYVKEIESYMENNHIYDLFRNLTMNLVKDKPSNPIKYLISHLKHPKIVNIVIIGPAGSNKKECATSIAEKLQISDVISASALLNQEVKLNTEIGKKIVASRKNSIYIDDEIVLRLVKNALESFKKEGKSWILEGFPRTKAQAISMQKWGFLPDCFFILNTDLKSIVESIREKILSPDYATVGALQEFTPEAIENYIQQSINNYNLNINEIKSLNKDFYYEIDTNIPFEDVVEEILAIANVKVKVNAPIRMPRIIFLGPPGSGRSTIGEKVAKKLGLVYVSTQMLLQEEVKNNSFIGKIAVDLTKNGELIPDEYIIKLIEKRLKCSDCLVNGWVLDNFPKTEAQIKVLKTLRLIPSCIFILLVNEKVTMERIEGRKIDLDTGEIYCVKRKVVDDENIAHRLVEIEQDKEEIIKKRISLWKSFYSIITNELNDKIIEINCDRNIDSIMTEIIDKIETL